MSKNTNIADLINYISVDGSGNVVLTTGGQVATQSYVTTAVSNLVNSAPSTLDTLNELATALGNDANFATTVTNSIATKLPLSGGTLTGALNGTSATFSGAISLGNNNTFPSGAGIFQGTNTLQIVSGSSGFTVNNNANSVVNFRVENSGAATFTSSVTATSYIGESATTELRLKGGGYGGSYHTSLRSGAGAIGVLQLGNNGDNYILAGNTAVGGYLIFRVNCSSESITSGIEAMRINTSGNMGIKSSNPTASISLGSSSYDSNPLAGLEYSQVSGGGRLDLKVQTWGSGSDYGLTTGLTLLTPGFDTKSLRVGIGTSSPDSGLNIDSGSTRGLRIDTNSGVQGFSMSPNSVFGIDEPGLSNKRFNINTNGYVGVGISNPDYKMHILGSGAFTGLEVRNNDTSGSFNRASMQAKSNIITLAITAWGSGSVRAGTAWVQTVENYPLILGTNDEERARVDSGGFTANRIYTTSGGGVNIVGGAALVLGGSGASFDNTTGARLIESYGAVWNFSNSATWHHQIINGSSLVGFNASGGNYGSGNIYATGSITASYSDIRLKKNFVKISDALSKVCYLSGYTYQHNELGEELLKENPHKVHAGFKAQEVKEVLPEAVTIAPFDLYGYDELGNPISKSGESYLTINYDRLGVLFVEAIKELKAENDELREILNRNNII